jgi:hypothetical protein
MAFLAMGSRTPTVYNNGSTVTRAEVPNYILSRKQATVLSSDCRIRAPKLEVMLYTCVWIWVGIKKQMGISVY